MNVTGNSYVDGEVLYMGNEYYIASCVFSTQFPELSYKIQDYISKRFNMSIVRCCIPKYKVREFEEKMKIEYRAKWSELPDSAIFKDADTVYSLCHNCSNIIEETKNNVKVISLWELILSDSDFIYPDYGGIKVTIQDCWRAKERFSEQNAVRSLLRNMNIDFVEVDENLSDANFCGVSLYRPQPIRNPQLAPVHYEKNAVGKFLPHTLEEQKAIMMDYCKQFSTEIVVCYCHYCLEGLQMGGKKGKHIAELLFR